ncbi:MAG: DUF2442 domain-containing protein [Bacteroidota bacterium]
MPMNAVVVNAKYIEDFKVKIGFADGKISLVDFSDYLATLKNPYLKKYQTVQFFQNFMIENGNIVWGEDWDLIFPRDQLYDGKIEI